MKNEITYDTYLRNLIKPCLTTSHQLITPRPRSTTTRQFVTIWIPVPNVGQMNMRAVEGVMRAKTQIQPKTTKRVIVE